MNKTVRTFLIYGFCLLPLGANAFDFVKRLTPEDIRSDKPAYGFNKTVDPITDAVIAKATYKSGSNFFTYKCNNSHSSISAYIKNTSTDRYHSNIIFRFDKNKPIKVKSKALTLHKKTTIEQMKMHFSLVEKLVKSDQVAIRIPSSLDFGLGDEKDGTAVFKLPQIEEAVTKVNAAAGCTDISEYGEFIAEKAKLEREKAIAEAVELEQALSEKQAVMKKIMDKVNENWKVPPDVSCLSHAEVRVRLSEKGSVLLVSILRSSNDPVFDMSVENAVNRADPLPMPTSPILTKQFRDIRFVFKPKLQECYRKRALN